METNVIYCGDNLETLPKYVHEDSVELVYIDPPFHSNRKYEVFWGEAQERRSFEDRHQSIGAYLEFMEPRVRHLYRVLKQTGSFYFHCDWHAGHYIKVMLDGIFGESNFRAEIVWRRSAAHSDTKQGSRQHGRVHDVLLFYTKGKDWTWNPIYLPYDEDYLSSEYRHRTPNERYYKETDLTASKPGGETEYAWYVKRPVFGRERWQADLDEEYRNPKPGCEYREVKPYRGRYWAFSKQNLIEFARQGKLIHRKTGMPRLMQFADEMPGVPLQDVWTDIPPLGAKDKERLGFPTQKPVRLLERILATSSNPGDVVLDAFCGCGTTLEAAAKMRRQWIGVDSSPTACRVMSRRLELRLGLRQGHDFQLREMPKTLEDLRRMPPFEFENWAVLALEGTPNRVKQGDLGIDGRVYPARVAKATTKPLLPTLFDAEQLWLPIQVKQQDKAGRPDIDKFETAMRRDRRVRGYFVAFGFSSGALREIDRAERQDGLSITPLTVNDLLEFERTAA